MRRNIEIEKEDRYTVKDARECQMSNNYYLCTKIFSVLED